jgi:Delta7-sterol 5-desaturase
MTQMLEWVGSLPVGWAALVFLLENAGLLGVTVIVGNALVSIFQRNLIAEPPPPVTRVELLLVASSVALNTLVTLAGWWLWRAGLIRIRQDWGWGVLQDVVVLVIVMDFAMYVLHRVAHHPSVYRWVHLAHHAFENPRPMSLFALNPLEVLGFGGLWLLVLMLYPASLLGIVIYLGFNLAFGLIGHLGVEPAPWWTRVPGLRYVMTSTFHAGHHHDKDHNFGFYTLVWDRIFGTLEPSYFEPKTKPGLLE